MTIGHSNILMSFITVCSISTTRYETFLLRFYYLRHLRQLHILKTRHHKKRAWRWHIYKKNIGCTSFSLSFLAIKSKQLVWQDKLIIIHQHKKHNKAPAPTFREVVLLKKWKKSLDGKTYLIHFLCLIHPDFLFPKHTHIFLYTDKDYYGVIHAQIQSIQGSKTYKLFPFPLFCFSSTIFKSRWKTRTNFYFFQEN